MIWSLLRKRENAPIGPALLGKLPCQPDFVREGFRGPASDALDAFLVQASPILHQGIGVEKLSFMPRLFGPEDLAAMVAIRQAFNPDGRCSPTKMLPSGGGCVERKSPGRKASA